MQTWVQDSSAYEQQFAHVVQQLDDISSKVTEVSRNASKDYLHLMPLERAQLVKRVVMNAGLLKDHIYNLKTNTEAALAGINQENNYLKSFVVDDESAEM